MKRFITIELLLLFILVQSLSAFLWLDNKLNELKEVKTTYELKIAYLDTALSYLGERETKSNSGTNIDKFIAYGGGKIGWAWCMYYVYYCVGNTYENNNLKPPLKRTGSVARQFNYCYYRPNVTKVILKQDYPTTFFSKIDTGDILIYKYGRGKDKRHLINKLWRGHTGFVISKNDVKKTLNTIEGNTNKKGSREGDGVYLKKRYSTNKKLVGVINIK